MTWNLKEVREITSRSKRYSMELRIKKLNQYLVGWCGYYALAYPPPIFKDFDKWMKQVTHVGEWKDWKKPKKRIRKLIGLGCLIQ